MNLFSDKLLSRGADVRLGSTVLPNECDPCYLIDVGTFNNWIFLLDADLEYFQLGCTDPVNVQVSAIDNISMHGGQS